MLSKIVDLQEHGFSLRLEICEHFDIFNSFGFEGNGYSWESLLEAILQRDKREFLEFIDLDSEADSLVIYGKDRALLEQIQMIVDKLVEDREFLKDNLIKSRDEIED